MSKSLTSEFLDMKRQYDADNQLIAEMEKNPLTESQLTEMMNRGIDQYDTAKQLKRLQPVIADLRQRGLITADKKITFKEFQDQNPDALCIRGTTISQMKSDEYRQIKEYLQPKSVWPELDDRKYKRMAVYSDGDGGKVQHYTFNKNGETHQSGFGMSISTNSLPSPVSDADRQKFNDAEKQYKTARNDIKDIVKKLGING